MVRVTIGNYHFQFKSSIAALDVITKLAEAEQLLEQYSTEEGYKVYYKPVAIPVNLTLSISKE